MHSSWGQPGQKKKKCKWDHISTNKLGVVVFICHPNYTNDIGKKRPSWAKIWDPTQKIIKVKNGLSGVVPA
jgi:hypothetical protein